MADQWFIRVEGREYGPADLATLGEWKEEGRVLISNEARRNGSQHWIRAGEIPGLFQPLPPAPPPIQAEPAAHRGSGSRDSSGRAQGSGGPAGVSEPETPGLGRICFDTVVLYIRGFFPFLGLTLLVLLPSVLAQLTGAMLDASAETTDIDLRTTLTAGFTFCMLLLTLAAWPIYLTGIQLLTADLALGRRLKFFPLLNSALKFWPRVAGLCVFVYVAFAFWTVLPMGVILMLGVGAPSAISSFLIVAIGAIQVWIIGRLFVNFLFWQQTAVLDERNMPDALRESKAVARGGSHLPFLQRPLWQGVIVSSLWLLLVIGLNLPTLIPAAQQYWEIVSTVHDPQKVLEAVSNLSKGHGIDRLGFSLGLLQAMLRPLLGIAFVLIFFASKSRSDTEAG